MMARRGFPHRTTIVTLTVVLLGAVPFAAATTELRCASGIVARIHNPDEIADQWLQRASARLYLAHPAAGEVELITGPDDPRLTRATERFYPFDPVIVAQALEQVHGLATDVAVEVFILPYPPLATQTSYAVDGNIFLAPGYGPVAPETVAYITTHELGHVLTGAFVDASPARWQAYRTLRGISAAGDEVRTPHAWRPREILAEDIRYLFGGPLATSCGSIENGQLPLPDMVVGLRELLVDFLAAAPAAGMLAVPGIAFPNPCNPAVNVALISPAGAHPALAATAELRIFDLRGRLVRTVVGGRSEHDRVVVRWNGNDASGNRVASGQYLYVMKVDDRVARGSLSVVK